MELLHAHTLSFYYPDKPDKKEVLRSVTLTLREGERLGLVGANGAGKSTLLRLLAGQLTPTEGSVVKSPGVRLALLTPPTAQQGTVWQAGLATLGYVRSLEHTLRDEEVRLSRGEDRLAAYGELTELFERLGGYGAEAGLERTLALFGFGPKRHAQAVASLSGGERARLALALTLAQQPDVMLLDEPSAHLDITMKRALATRLTAHRGGLILASHDRALLDAVCTHTAELKGAQLTRYRGNYSTTQAQTAHTLRSLRKTARETDKERARLSAAVARMTGGPAVQRQRQAIRGRLARLEPPAFATTTAPPRDLPLKTERTRGTLLSATHLSKRFAGREVVRDVSLRIDAGDRVALVGPNGVGKSTLLGLLTGALESDHPETTRHLSREAKVAVFDQATRGVAAETPVLTQLSRLVSVPRARLLLALVGLAETDWAKPPEALSLGQRARAGVALLIASEANLLLLDEPTEHLDITMIERLEDALQDTQAAFVLVSHDETLVERVAKRVWTLADSSLHEFRGGLDGYVNGTLRLNVDPDDLTFGQTVSDADETLLEKTVETGTVAETVEEKLERLETEHIALDTCLLDPLRLSARERERAERRYRTVTDELSVLYDQRLPPPAAAYSRRDGPVTVTADQTGEGRYLFGSNVGLEARLLVSEGVGHLVLALADDRSPLPWARVAALQVVARLGLERLGLVALQLQSPDNLAGTGFERAAGDWWTLTRRRYERQQGYVSDGAAQQVRSGRRRRRRRKRLAS